MNAHAAASIALALACSCEHESTRNDPPPPTPPPTRYDAAPPAPPDATVQTRWIARSFEGYAIDARAPELRLCDDGRYIMTTTYEMEVDRVKAPSGRACCTDKERGTYELVRDAQGTLTGVQFTPIWSMDTTLPAPYTSLFSGGNTLHGLQATGSAGDCR